MAHNSRFLSMAALGCWKSGLGKIMNLAPNWLGQNLVLSFPAQKKETVLSCYESDGQLFAVMPLEDYRRMEEALLSGTGAEVWMRNGWFSASVTVIPEEDLQQMILPANEVIYGRIGSALGGSDLSSEKILKIKRNAPCTGEHGPGSYAWVWAVLCGLLVTAKSRKKS